VEFPWSENAEVIRGFWFGTLGLPVGCEISSVISVIALGAFGLEIFDAVPATLSYRDNMPFCESKPLIIRTLNLVPSAVTFRAG
jgi:hypothetical protein